MNPPSIVINAYFKSGIIKEKSLNTLLNLIDMFLEKLNEKEDNFICNSSFSLTLNPFIVLLIF